MKVIRKLNKFGESIFPKLQDLLKDYSNQFSMVLTKNAIKINKTEQKSETN